MSDHVSITVDILIFEEYVQSIKQSLIKNSDEESHFVDKLISSIKSLKTDSI